MTDLSKFQIESCNEVTSSEEENVNTKIMMNQDQALSYMILASQDVKISLEQIKKIHSSMVSKFNLLTPNEAEEQSENQFHSMQEKAINHMQYKNQGDKLPEVTFKKLNVRIPTTVPEFPSTKRRREENERIIKELRHVRNAPFGLFKFFCRCKR